ncbi:hypothetical protein GCM10022254_09210 [Actinomadura meridiana]|uniref:Uncharacterized protein n=1 Tax=Actinomadura meridiana TaxID=559626 RepID=A0ABP8BU29_9ACTN
MADLTPEREAQIRERLTEAFDAIDYTIGDLAARDLLAELDAIRRRDETTGGVLYDVIRRTRAGQMDEHEAVRAIEARLLHPMIAQVREARARAGGRRRQRDAATGLAGQVRELRALLGEVLTLRQTVDSGDPAWRDLDRRVERAARADEEVAPGA